MSWQRTRKATLAHMQNAQKNKEIPQLQKVPAGNMLAASYYTGNGFDSIKTILNMSGMCTQSRATFYRQQEKCEKNVIKYAEKTMEDAREEFSGNMAIDCRWSSPRNGIHGTVSAVDTVNHKVIEYYTMTKEGKNRPNGTYEGSPNNMETIGTSSIISQLKHHNIFEKVEKIIKDRDNKSKKLLEEVGVEELIYNDPGHFRKSFKKSLQSLISENRTFNVDDEEVIKNPFYSLQTPIEKWMNKCLKEDQDDKRISMWLSLVPHFLGDHSNCTHEKDKECLLWLPGIENDELADILEDFVDEQAVILARISNKYTTQSVESLNALYGKCAPKKTNWNRIDGRIAAAVIRQNDPENAPMKILECCQAFTLNPAAYDELLNDSHRLVNQRNYKRKPEVMRQKNKSRLIFRNKYKEDPNGDYGNSQQEQ